MNKWYFSKDNTITEPMDFESAKKYVAANLDAYGWQQSYTQWLPVHCISDFADIIPPVKPLAVVPQGVIDEFNNKSQKIIENVTKVNTDISNGEKLLQVFAQEIDTYKNMTLKLSPEVQANINGIEQHYLSLQQQLKEIKQTTHTTANEVSQVVTNFNLKITDKSVAPLTSELQKNIAKQITKSDVKAQPVIEDEIDKAIREKLKISPPDLTRRPSTEVKSSEPAKEASTEAKSAEPAKDIPTEAKSAEPTKEILTEEKSPESAETVSSDEKIVNIRPPRPAGAKVISTRSNKPGPGAGAHYINTNNEKSTKEENLANDTAEKSDKAIKDAEVVAKKPNTVKIIGGIPVISLDETAESEPGTKTAEQASAQQNANIEAEKIKGKIGAGVKNIFSSMFGSEPPPPPISSALKDLVNKKEEESVITEEIEDYDQPLKQKRRRRR